MGVVNKQVLIITIGPVQQFIAQARKTRDLWYGSHLLSELSKVAAQTLMSSGVTLIFPSIGEGDSWNNLKVANKIIGVVEVGGNPREIALAVRKAVAMSWINRADNVKKRLEPYINTSMWDRQIKDFIECYAVWTPMAVDESDYDKAVERADQLMTARKSLRDFCQNEPGALFGDKKSRLDSGRESVIWPEQLRNLARFGIKRGETLDAISLVKRLSNKIDSKIFPSVCDMAFLPYRNKIQNNESKMSDINSFYEDVRYQCADLQLKGSNVNDYESALFYENRVEEFVAETLEQLREKQGSGFRKTNDEEEHVSGIVKRITQLRSKYRIDSKQLPNYYAFIMCDGDNMGETLRLMKTIGAHKEFSEKLSNFATAAEEIISHRNQSDGDKVTVRGQLVYSGGDDVMAYVSLSDCMEVCEKLQQKFTEIMRDAVPVGLPRPTLSIGVAIVHMLERLEVACNLARRAEHDAKSNGKNRISIIMQKRHGGTLSTISLPFGDVKDILGGIEKGQESTLRPSPTLQVKEFQRYYRNGYFSTKFPHELREMYLEYRSLIKGSAWHNDEVGLHKLLSLEVERLLRKKKPSQLSDSKYAEFVTWVRTCFHYGVTPSNNYVS